MAHVVSAVSSAGVLMWLGLRPSALRRRSDRLEIAARWLAIGVVALSVLAAPTVANGWEQRLARQASHYQSYPAVSATLLEDVSQPLTPGPDPAVPRSTRARWLTPDGRSAQGRVPAPAGARAGEVVRVRLGPDGLPAATPPTALEAAIGSALAGIAVPALAVFATVLWLAMVRALLSPQRQRYWDEAWAVFDRPGNAPTG